MDIWSPVFLIVLLIFQSQLHLLSSCSILIRYTQRMKPSADLWCTKYCVDGPHGWIHAQYQCINTEPELSLQIKRYTFTVKPCVEFGCTKCCVDGLRGWMHAQYQYINTEPGLLLQTKRYTFTVKLRVELGCTKCCVDGRRGRIHAQYQYTYTEPEPGMFWCLYVLPMGSYDVSYGEFTEQKAFLSGLVAWVIQFIL